MTKLFPVALLIILSTVALSACSSPAQYFSDKKKPVESEPAPTPKPTPPKKPDVVRCKISNGEGRVFEGVDLDRDESEAKARHECEIFSRHCTLLDCNAEDGE